MKRNFPDGSNELDNSMSNLSGGYSESKMSRRSGDDGGITELRFLVPGKAAGVIIGRGGENVREIREKYEIKVNIPDSPGPERVLQVSGRTNIVMQALQLILEKAKECFPSFDAEVYVDGGRSRGRNKHSRSNRDDETGAGEGDNSVGVDLRMLVHQSQAGGVIGRGGERIKELREQVNLKHLKIYQNTCPSSTDRVIQMVGEIPKVLHCVHSVLEMIQMFPIRGSEQPYDARNFDETLALSYGGWLSKPAFKAVQEYGAPACGVMPAGGGGGGGSSNSNSAIAAIAAARANMINQGTTPPPSRMLSGGMPRQPPMMMMQPNLVMGGSRSNRGNSQMNFLGSAGMEQNMFGGGSVKTTQVSVPNSYMGAIMGRAGCRIRSIREESGADIKIHEPEKGSPDRVIDISGTPTQISYAQQLLKSCVLLYHDRS